MQTTARGIDILDFLDTEGRARYAEYVKGGQRIPQAWMNSAPAELYNAITGTVVDPFYRTTVESVVRAIEFVTR